MRGLDAADPEIEVITRKTQGQWDEFLSLVPYATAFHSTFYRHILSETFPQLKPHYIILRKNGEIILGCPLFTFKPLPFFSSLHSNPFHMYGGILLSEKIENAPNESVNRMLAYVENFSKKTNTYSSSITFPPKTPQIIHKAVTCKGYTIERTQPTHLLNINRPFKDIWDGYRKVARKAVRKAEKSGVIVEPIKTIKDLKTFYNIYLKNMSRINATPKPYQLFKKLFEEKSARFTQATYNNIMISGLVVLHFNKTASAWIISSNPNYHEVRPNNATHNEAIQYACQRGFHTYSFGEANPEDGGLIHFKETWNAIACECKTYTRITKPTIAKVWEKLEAPLRAVYRLKQQIGV